VSVTVTLLGSYVVLPLRAPTATIGAQLGVRGPRPHHQPSLSGAVAGIEGLVMIPATLRRCFRWEENYNASAAYWDASANSARLVALQRRSYARVPAPYDQSLIGRYSLTFHHFRMCATRYMLASYGQ
jgi:hypothetical protein